MPYITKPKRLVLDPIVDDLINALRGLECDYDNDNLEGNINYFVTRVLDRLYNKNYADVNSAIGVLNCIQLEYYRRMAVPYEDQKAYENGDVYSNTVSSQIGD